ncbi:lipase 1 [Drosophila ficusphila]|uniref:lipase 1 n=1 Tax=Drosophila ficusphila TaxID=30025 RepID=UPI0007E63A96|nr:lipase 1 [Drosophila ficusphila]
MSEFGWIIAIKVMLIVCAIGKNASSSPPESRYKWTTVDWLEAQNVSYEAHNVTTADGYQLQVQRLPRLGAKPVLLVHGLLGSSLGWVCLGPEKSLAFQLFNRKYDVWLANLRGVSPYGRQHTDLTDVMAEFWSFSFHEHGAYDLPAIIDHMARVTSGEQGDPAKEGGKAEEEGQVEEEAQGEHEYEEQVPRQVLLIGHSQAFNAFLVLCSVHPRFNQRIQLIQGLAPLARLHRQVRFDSNQVRRLMKFVKKRQKISKFEVFPPGYLRKICQSKQDLCEYYTKQFVGSAHSNKKLLEAFNYEHLLQGGSAKEIKHLQQIWKSGDFISYDYGPLENMQIYHGVEAFGYNLSQITVPIILYFGETDAVATPNGVHGIYARMLKSVKSVRRINSPKFNHLDFIVSGEVKSLVNDKLIEQMEQFLEGRLPYVIE